MPANASNRFMLLALLRKRFPLQVAGFLCEFCEIFQFFSAVLWSIHGWLPLSKALNYSIAKCFCFSQNKRFTSWLALSHFYSGTATKAKLENLRSIISFILEPYRTVIAEITHKLWNSFKTMVLKGAITWRLKKSETNN